MAAIKHISLIGMGALGCAYGHKLYDLDPDHFRVLAGSERINRYKENGFIINGKRYDFPYITPDEDVVPADLLIFAVKSTQLADAIKDARRHVGKDTIIMSLLNGITSEKIIAETYGRDKLLYALSNGIDATRDGNRVRFSTYGVILFGEKSNAVHSQRVKAVASLFQRAGIPYEIPEDMIRALWFKFMVNVGINQTSAVTRATYGTFQKSETARKLMVSAMHEVVLIAEKAGIRLSDDDIQKQLKIIAQLNPDGKTSMLQDIASGRKTEVDMFSGMVCRLGERYGVPTPINKALYRIIKTIENR